MKRSAAAPAATPKSMTILLAALTLSACAGQGNGDALTANIADAGISTTGANEAVWLAAPRPGLSAVGKDYLFVGPVTVNRDGRRQNYLWFALGTTIDRRITGAVKPTLESVVMLVDGTPMTFDIVPWDGQGAASPYRLQVDSYASYVARITASQVRQLANAAVVEAYVTDADGRSPVYSVVRGDPRQWGNAAGPGYSASTLD